jgi:hypothetical protein
MPRLETTFWDMREQVFDAVCYEERVAGALAMVS